MKILKSIFLVLALAGGAGAFAGPGPDKLVVHFFGSRTCRECLEIKEEILLPLAEEYPHRLSLRIHYLDDKESFQLLDRLEKRFGITESSPQELFLPNAYLLGASAIMESGEEIIREHLNHPEQWKSPESELETGDFDVVLKRRSQHFTFLGILVAGLVDGVNPCAIATMIFLISFLAAQHRKRSEIITIGLVYTAAVYLTYLLIGLGAFKALTLLHQYSLLSSVIRWSAVALAAVVGLLSFRDAWIYHRSGRTEDISLQLPKAIKLRLHRLISVHLRGRHLITGALVTGFLVTLLEAVCTGQVYLPTILLMTRSTGLRLRGWIYLLFYNFLFVLPLLIVMFLAYGGLTWDKLARVTRSHLVLLKVLLGVVMVGLAVFLVFA